MSFVLAALLAVGQGAACPVEGATYRYDSDPGVTLQIRPIAVAPSSLYLTISDNHHHELWFTLDQGSADSSIRLVSSRSDPGDPAWKAQDPDSGRDRVFADIRYFLFTSDGNPMPSALHHGMRAPERIFVPDLGEQLFYKRDPSLFSRIGLPDGLFRLKRCGTVVARRQDQPVP